MVKDTLANFKLYCTPNSLLFKGFDYLQNQYSPTLKDGRYEIEGDHCFALVQSYDTVPSAEKRYESHKLYLDIQYVVSGTEIIEYAPITDLSVEEDRTPGADLIFFKPFKGADLVLKAGEF